MTELTNYKVSKHAMERYCERIMSKNSANDINRFMIENEEKIITDINKLLTFGSLIYQGKTAHKDGKGNFVNVFLKDTWVVIADPKSENVITLYKIDLGCGDDFNNQYISKMIDKLNKNKEILTEAQSAVEQESIMYRNMITEAEGQINEYRAMIKNLEGLCEGYKTIVDNNTIKVSQANREVAEVVNTLIGKKEF